MRWFLKSLDVPTALDIDQYAKRRPKYFRRCLSTSRMETVLRDSARGKKHMSVLHTFYVDKW